jgi:hypothetical protein
MRFEKIWVQQCRATKTIKRRFGAKSALDYLIREKLITFADEAERSPEYAKELPRFLAAIWQVFNNTSLPDISRARNQLRESNYASCCICNLRKVHPSLLGRLDLQVPVRYFAGNLKAC